MCIYKRKNEDRRYNSRGSRNRTTYDVPLKGERLELIVNDAGREYISLPLEIEQRARKKEKLDHQWLTTDIMCGGPNDPNNFDTIGYIAYI